MIRFLEFFAIGLVFGIGEDLLAIRLTTNASITLEMIGLVFIVTLPFAIFSELIVDHPGFWKKIWPAKDKDEEKQEL